MVHCQPPGTTTWYRRLRDVLTYVAPMECPGTSFSLFVSSYVVTTDREMTGRGLRRVHGPRNLKEARALSVERFGRMQEAHPLDSRMVKRVRCESELTQVLAGLGKHWIHHSAGLMSGTESRRSPTVYTITSTLGLKRLVALVGIFLVQIVSRRSVVTFS